MKKIFSLCAALLMAATMFAGRSFSAAEELYLNAGAVSWWQDGNAVQIATFNDGTENHRVVGEPAADPSKVKFLVPAGTYETVTFSRHETESSPAWNATGAIALTGTEGNNMVATFAQNATDATWGIYDGSAITKPACPEALYMIGNIQNVGWNPGKGIAMTKNGDIFTATATFVAEDANTVCYFCFTSTNSTEWADVNANRYGSAGDIVAGAGAVDITYPGEKNATIAPGTYTITVDWDTMTIVAQVYTALEDCNVEQKTIKLIENGQLIILKDGIRYNALGAAL